MVGKLCIQIRFLLQDHVIFCREIMHAMWKPQKFKYVYLFATLYVFTLTLPSATAVYWAFGDQLLTHSNAFALLPRNKWRDVGVTLMLIHQVMILLKTLIVCSCCFLAILPLR